MKVKLRVVGQLIHDLTGRKQATTSNMHPQNGFIPLYCDALKHQDRVIFDELRIIPDNKGQDLVCNHLRHRMSVAHRKRIWVAAQYGARVVHRSHLPRLNQAFVPAWFEPRVRINLEVPVFALIEPHRQRARPAWTARLKCIDPGQRTCSRDQSSPR